MTNGMHSTNDTNRTARLAAFLLAAVLGALLLVQPALSAQTAHAAEAAEAVQAETAVLMDGPDSQRNLEQAAALGAALACAGGSAAITLYLRRSKQ